MSKKGKVVEAPSKDNKKENIKRNSEVSSIIPFLSENVVDKEKDSNTSWSL
ncbi:hypothetical protein [Wolbachia endosymbiont of Brugia pahangi]|uniref:hypothetical protein n=1 Tax=Wolbachia endosymbiont of Brugia pahangi TaxID=96495 RepID=UPI001435BAB9|nr:hypothetical protein [Wolbachia endosymbiont of Brugia pahangi]QIT35697.1 hypothetical protein WBP_0327 [Wolbachia endosymbiont of Brugia pahangi]